MPERNTTQSKMKRVTETRVKGSNSKCKGILSGLRVFVGSFLAIVCVFKDIVGFIFFGTVRLFTESWRCFIRTILRLAKEITVSSMRMILGGVEELWNIVIGNILQAIDCGSRFFVRQLQQIITILGYSVVVVVFAVAYFVIRIMKSFFNH